MHRPTVRKMNPRISDNFVGRRQIFASPTMPRTPTELLSDHTASSSLSSIPGHQSRSSANRIHSAVLPDQQTVPQTHPSFSRQSKRIADDDSEYGSPDQHESPDKDELVAAKQRRNSRVLGVELEHRRRQAEDRIRQGGWKADLAEMAIEWAGSKSWFDEGSKNHSVRAFARDAESLGELCSDMKAIRGFLDKNIHKFIAFHAMEKDFKVPDYLVNKASQRRRDRRLKYPWLRSFIREYQGAPSAIHESLVQVYKEQVDEHHDRVRTLQSAPTDLDGSIHVAVPTAPTTVGTDASSAGQINDGRPDMFHVTLGNTRRRRKRRHQTFDDSQGLENSDMMKTATTFSDENDFIDMQDTNYEADTGDAGVKGPGGTGGANDGHEVIRTSRGALKVVFHGTEDDDVEESEHLQVYVPRTSKGVTINFF